MALKNIYFSYNASTAILCCMNDSVTPPVGTFGMNYYFSLISLSLFTSAILTRLLVQWGNALGLIQSPNERSSHTQATPTAGGLSLLIALFVTLLFNPTNLPSVYLHILFIGLPLAITGLFDDLFSISANTRLFIQFFTIITAIYTIEDPSKYYNLGEGLTLWRIFLVSIIIGCGIWWINLFNFMDGIDGLAASQAAFMTSAGIVCSLLVSINSVPYPSQIFMAMLLGATIGFLFFNWSPAKIFMGDVGSTWLAYILFALALLTIKEGLLSTAFWIILSGCFVTDASVTLVNRFLDNERLNQAHRCHAYQLITDNLEGDRTNRHKKVCLIFLCINLLWLSPLACLSLTRPQLSLYLIILAYVPIIISIILVRMKLNFKKPNGI